ncbi:universal stress protein [Rhodococcus koreensis]|uniref:universal stress protein n=1 Tax=Rhodococcus koreensis TaxID=99653 RepID=UPI0009345C1E|nr:universal stress protein [Rhodococcus koreensis]
MSGPSDHRHIVVGIDGSRGALNAAAWATEIAALHRVPLRLLCVHDPSEHEREVEPHHGEHERQRAQDAHRHLTEAADVARHVAASAPTRPGNTEIRMEMRAGTSFTTLLEAADAADLLVLGARNGSSSGSESLVTTAALIARAACPVAVVRAGFRRTGGPVVTGVRSECEPDVLHYAFRYAHRRGSLLRAVHCVLAGPGSSEPGTEHAAGSNEARDLLDTWLEPDEARFPDVVVDPITTETPADVALVRYSSSAELVVVGRGAPHPPRGILGRTATSVFMHAMCPVIFVGPHRRDRYPRA